MKKKILLRGFSEKYFYVLLLLTGLFAFIPSPFYRTFTAEQQKFTSNTDLMEVLKRTGYSQVHNDEAYFYFTDAANYVGFRNLSLKEADSVLIRYRAYPLNRRNLFSRSALHVRFEDKDESGTFVQTHNMPGSYRTRTFRAPIPEEEDVHLFVTSGLGNIVDQYVLVVEEVRVLNRTLPWWGVLEFFANYRPLFLGIFSLLLVAFLLRKVKKKKILLLFFGIVILFHFFNAVPLERLSPYFADAAQYQSWGRTMLQHGVIGPSRDVSSTHWPPLWPFVLGVLEYLYDGGGTLISFMTFIQMGILVFIYLLGARFFSKGVGMMAVILFSLYPETLIRSKVYYSEPLFLLLTLAFLYFYLLLREKRTIRYGLLTLLTFLAALHTKQEILLLWAFILPLEFFLNRKNVKMYLLLTLLIGVGCLPYVYRNYRVTDSFVFISSTFGQNLLMGNCFRIEELEYGPLNQPYPYGDTRYTPEQLEKIQNAEDAMEVNDLNTRFALEYLREVDIFQHISRKVGLYLFWEGYPYEINLYLFSVPWGRYVGVLAVSLLAFLFVFFRRVYSREILLVTLAPVAMNAAIGIVFFLRAERHRYLAMPFILLLISAFVCHVWTLFRKDKKVEE